MYFALTILSAALLWVFSPTQSIYMIWVFAQSLKWSGLGLIARASKECSAPVPLWAQSTGYWVLDTKYWAMGTEYWVMCTG